MADDDKPAGDEQAPHAVPSDDAAEIAGSAEDAALEAAQETGRRRRRQAPDVPPPRPPARGTRCRAPTTGDRGSAEDAAWKAAQEAEEPPSTCRRAAPRLTARCLAVVIQRYGSTYCSPLEAGDALGRCRPRVRAGTAGSRAAHARFRAPRRAGAASAAGALSSRCASAQPKSRVRRSSARRQAQPRLAAGAGCGGRRGSGAVTVAPGLTGGSPCRPLAEPRLSCCVGVGPRALAAAPAADVGGRWCCAGVLSSCAARVRRPQRSRRSRRGRPGHCVRRLLVDGGCRRQHQRQFRGCGF